MASIKLYYLTLVANIDESFWDRIKAHLNKERTVFHESSVFISTKDAHTLTDGPTIYLADDVDKIARFCLQSASIPREELETISQAISFNAIINEKVSVLTKKLEDLTAADAANEKKMSDSNRGSPEVKELRRKIDELQEQKQSPCLINTYQTWQNISSCKPKRSRYRSCLNRMSQMLKIMLIDDVDDHWKLLLMMGIKVFAAHDSDRYKVMKQLAQEQKLYLISHLLTTYMVLTTSSVMDTLAKILGRCLKKRQFKPWDE